jgi:protein tyrosine phosphatase (PTP) superfamily phosphohydrolase (DUF442 family)
LSVMDKVQVADIYNYLRIDETLSTGGQPSVEELAAAAREGFEVVINLALHDDPRYSLPDERRSVESLGMTYEHIPVKFDAPTQDDLLAFFDLMDRHQGKRVLLHCAANKRVTSFLGIYRVMRKNWEIQPAFAPMREIWEPNEVWAPFISAMLMKQPGKKAPPLARS